MVTSSELSRPHGEERCSSQRVSNHAGRAPAAVLRDGRVKNAASSGRGPRASRRLRAIPDIPVEYLLAGPKQHVTFLTHFLDDAPEIFGPVSGARDVGMDGDSHDASGALGIGIDLLELGNAAIIEFRSRGAGAST